jgi:hypothetical protein
MEAPEDGPVTLYNPTTITTDSMKLSWTKAGEGAFEMYEVHKSTSQGFIIEDNTLEVRIQERDSTRYQVADLQPNTRYYFKVRHYTTGESHYDSNEAGATTLPESGEDPVLPKPGIAILTPESGETFTPGNILVSGTAEGSYPISVVYVRIDNGSWESTTGTESWTYYWDASNVTGVHKIHARSYDGIAYSGTAYLTVLVQGEEIDDNETDQFVQMLMDNIFYIALLVIVLVVIVVAAKRR